MFNKKSKKGMADAAKAYQEFGQKQEDALNHILEEVRQGRTSIEEAIEKLGGNFDNLYEHLKSKEKARLYTVYTPFDIQQLGEQERLFLVGALLKLTTISDPNENQQNYMRAIQKYLDIKELPFNTDLMAVENIEDVPTQKAIYQAVLEYLRLQDGDYYDEVEGQQDFLDAFSLSKKARNEIAEHVERLYIATGAQGLAEKYGYVPEEEAEENQQSEQGTSTDDQQKEFNERNHAHEFESVSGEFVDRVFDVQTIGDIFGMSNLASWDNMVGSINIIETEDYVLRNNTTLFDKHSGESKEISCFNDKGSVSVYHFVAENVIYRRMGVFLWKVDLDTLISEKLFACECGSERFCVSGHYLVYFCNSENYIYNLETKALGKFPVDAMCTGVFPSKSGVYFSYTGKDYHITHLDHYDFETQKVKNIFCYQLNISKIYHVEDDKIFYVECGDYSYYRIDISDLKDGDIVVANRRYHYMHYPISHIGAIQACQDNLIFISMEGTIQADNYKTGIVTEIAPEAYLHHYTEGGLFKKSSSWNEPSKINRIGNWIIYRYKGGKLCRVSLDAPNEVVFIQQ